MKRAKNFRGIYLLLLTVIITSCCNNKIEGSWVEPVPSMAGMVQGFTLDKDGKATSINMATLRYQKWEKCGDLLILCGESIGNGQTINFTDTLTIKELTKENLVLTSGDMTFNYKREVKKEK